LRGGQPPRGPAPREGVQGGAARGTTFSLDLARGRDPSACLAAEAGRGRTDGSFYMITGSCTGPYEAGILLWDGREITGAPTVPAQYGTGTRRDRLIWRRSRSIFSQAIRSKKNVIGDLETLKSDAEERRAGGLERAARWLAIKHLTAIRRPTSSRAASGAGSRITRRGFVTEPKFLVLDESRFRGG